MSKFSAAKPSFLSTESVARYVQQMQAGGVELSKPSKAGRPWNARFCGGPKNANIVSPAQSDREVTLRSEEKQGTVVWDIAIGGTEMQDEPMKKRKETASKASFSVSVLKDTDMYERLTFFDNEIKRCAVELLVKNAKEPFKGNENIEHLLKNTKFLLREKEDSKYPPNMDIVVKPGPNDMKFTAGSVLVGFDKATGGLEIEEESDFSWDNIDEYVKKGAVIHKIKGYMGYASVFSRSGEITSINLQFQASKIILSLPIDAKDAYDSDEVVVSRPGKRPNSSCTESPSKRSRLSRTQSLPGKVDEEGNEETEEAASEGDADSKSED